MSSYSLYKYFNDIKFGFQKFLLPISLVGAGGEMHSEAPVSLIATELKELKYKLLSKDNLDDPSAHFPWIPCKSAF